MTGCFRAWSLLVLVRSVYLAVAQAFAVLGLLPMTDRAKTVDILALRHQFTVLQRQLGDRCVRLRPEDRVFLAALLVSLPCLVRRLRLALLCVPTFDVDLEFSGGVSQPGVVDVAVDVAVDRVQGLA